MNRWDLPNVPHRGWRITGEDDIGDATHQCEMCGNPEVRYVFTVEHDEHEPLQVGCVCAEKMTGDYHTPRETERKLKNRRGRRERFLQSPKWRINGKGNYTFKHREGRITIFAQRGGWSVAFKEVYWGPFPTHDLAVLSIFDAIDRL